MEATTIDGRCLLIDAEEAERYFAALERLERQVAERQAEVAQLEAEVGQLESTLDDAGDC